MFILIKLKNNWSDSFPLNSKANQKQFSVFVGSVACFFLNNSTRSFIHFINKNGGEAWGMGSVLKDATTTTMRSPQAANKNSQSSLLIKTTPAASLLGMWKMKSWGVKSDCQSLNSAALLRLIGGMWGRGSEPRQFLVAILEEQRRADQSLSTPEQARLQLELDKLPSSAARRKLCPTNVYLWKHYLGLNHVLHTF